MLEREHLENLEILADFLENELTDDQFDISSYKADGHLSLSIEKHSCGTIGCAMGWLPTALKDGVITADDDWESYTKAKVGCSDRGFDIGEYMFSCMWEYSDQETRMATVSRIRDVISSKGELTGKMKKLMYEHDI